MIGKKLKPFAFWCQKVLPTVYDDSLSYYEYLCKLNNYLNEVIEQINTLTTEMEEYEEDLNTQWDTYKTNLNGEWLDYKTELTRQWNETKDWITNYFDNLDVQEEINNKLDAMALDGTLSALLAPLVTTEVGSQIGDVVASQIGTTVANQIDSVVASQIGGSVAEQIADIAPNLITSWLNTNVDPVGSAVTVDASLSISGSAADAKVTGDNFEMIDYINQLKNTTFTNGTFVGYLDGDLGTIATCSSTDYFDVSNVNKIRLVNVDNVHVADYRGLAFYDGEKTFISGIQYTSTSMFIDVPSNAKYARFTVLTGNIYVAELYFNINQSTSFNNTPLDMINFRNILTGINLTNNQYINYTTGESSSISSCKSTDYIYIKNSKKLYLKNIDVVHTADIRGLAFYDENYTYISGIQYTDTSMYGDIPYNAVYARLTIANENLSCVEVYKSIEQDEIDNSYILNVLNAIDITNITNDKYIDYNNGVSSTMSNSSVTDYIRIPSNSMLIIENVDFNHVADLRGLAFYNKDKTYISGIQYTGNENQRIITEAPVNTHYIRLTIQTSKINLASMLIGTNYKQLIGLENSDDKSTNFDVLCAFNNIRCIGDSLTWSQVYTSNDNYRQSYHTYPYVLGIKTGATIETLAQSGNDAVDTWDEYNDDIISKPNMLTIIYLGTNNGLTDTLSIDADPSLPYTSWSNTNTGCYAKLVAKSLDVGSKVLLVKVYASSGASGVSDMTITNKVIDDIATRFGCGVIDSINLSELKYHYYPDLSGYNSLHYNDLGYSAFANALIESVSSMNTDNMKYLIP